MRSVIHILGNFSILSASLFSVACGGQKQEARPVLIEREVIDSRIDAFLKDMEREEHFTGVALVMKKEEIIHAKGYGKAKNETENRVTTAFHVASITKQFTAAATLQLVDRGILELEESINEYLPEEYRSSKWDNVILHDLLCHTSGITNYAVTRDYYEVVKGFCQGNTVDGMVKEAMGKELEFDPGSKFSYSDINYTLLGIIIESQTQMPYNEYMRVNVFEPIGMKDSRIHVIGHVPEADEAEGYRWSAEQSVHVLDDIVSLPVTEADGGLFTTLTDFAQWVGLYMDRKQTILNKNSISKMTSPLISVDFTGPRGNPQSYGYGLLLEDELVHHSGYIVGFRSDFILDRQKEILIAVFSNNTTNDPIRISTGLLKIVK